MKNEQNDHFIIPEHDSSFDNDLKFLSAHQVEKIIADALTKTMKANFTVKVRSLDYESDDNSLNLTSRTEITLVIEKTEKTILEWEYTEQVSKHICLVQPRLMLRYNKQSITQVAVNESIVYPASLASTIIVYSTPFEN